MSSNNVSIIRRLIVDCAYLIIMLLTHSYALAGRFYSFYYLCFRAE